MTKAKVYVIIATADKQRGIAQLVEQRSPKPRAEGSSPSAPAIHFWLRKAISEAFSLLILPKIIPPLCDVQIYGAVESVYRRLLCGLSTIDINPLGGLYAFVSEQNGNVLNRYAVVVENTRHYHFSQLEILIL